MSLAEEAGVGLSDIRHYKCFSGDWHKQALPCLPLLWFSLGVVVGVIPKANGFLSFHSSNKNNPFHKRPGGKFGLA